MKLLLETRSKNYYEAERNGNKLILGVLNFGETKTINQLSNGFEIADIPGYLKDKYSIESICKEPLGNLFDLNIYSFGSELQPKNYNLFEYEYFIKGNKEANKSLKSACICSNSGKDYFYIAVEPYESDLTREDIKIIESYVNTHIKELETLLNMNYSHTEIY